MKNSNDLLQLMSSVIKAAPKSGKETHAKKFLSLLEQDRYKEFRLSALRRVFNLEYVRAHKAVFPPTLQELANKSKTRSQHLEEDAREVELAKTMIMGNILDVVMMNGKTLRQCTGTECKFFGGFYSAVAERVGKRLVGRVLTNRDLVSIAQGYFNVTKRSVRHAAHSEVLQASL